MDLAALRDAVSPWGTVGDAVGGIANGVTMLFVIVGFWWARNEVHRNRQQHAEQVQAEAARDIYRAAHGMLTDVLRYRSMTDLVTPSTRREALKVELEAQIPVIRVAIADASLLFGEDLQALIHRLVKASDEALALSPHEGPERAQKVDAELSRIKADLLSYLRPFARLTFPK